MDGDVNDAQGITPACAGRRHIQGGCKLDDEDHPRVRGEKHGGTHAQLPGWGSPPRARGEAHKPCSLRR